MYGESNMETYITICKIDSQQEFAVWLSKLKQRLCINLEGWGGRETGGRFKRKGTYVYLWRIHVGVWQKTAKFCKAIILQKKKKIFPPPSWSADSLAGHLCLPSWKSLSHRILKTFSLVFWFLVLLLRSLRLLKFLCATTFLPGFFWAMGLLKSWRRLRN